MDARRIALETLGKVAGGAYADHALDRALKCMPRLDPRDRGLATELVYGVLRHRNRLDYQLRRCCKTPLQKLERTVLELLRLGAYQILELDRVPAPVAVHETVALARRLRLERATGLLNAVLRRLVREQAQSAWPDRDRKPVEHLTWALSLPEWLARRWHAELGPEAFALAACLLEPAPFTLRVNTLKISRAEYLGFLADAGHRGVSTPYAPEGVALVERGAAPLPGDRSGFYQVQDEASMLVAHLVAPQPGEKLLDVCAAPGGKTTHLAALAGNEAAIEAIDLHPHRVRLIEQGCRRLDGQHVSARAWDMRKPPPFFERETFDAVLVDAPCSGLGVLRRNPEARWRLQPADIAALAAHQAQILEQASSMVRPGGRLVYSVCTVTPEETWRVVEAFLATHADFRLQPLREIVPQGWQELLDKDGALRTWPHRDGMDGFFAVRLVKG